jgi:two-component system LytT family response regulator
MDHREPGTTALAKPSTGIPRGNATPSSGTRRQLFVPARVPRDVGTPLSEREPDGDLRVLVVDDEPLARELLRHMLTAAGAVVVGECTDGLQAIDAIRMLAPDLVLLDIEMPGIDGFEVIEAVGPEAMPPVIFVTAHGEHALRAFQVHALDYVLKPISAPRFAECFRVARARLHASAPGANETALRSLLAARGREQYRRRFLVRRRDRLVVVGVDEVDLIESAGNYVRLDCGDHASLFRATIASLERELDPSQFLRIHRSLIVRIDRVGCLERDGQGELLAALKNGRCVPVQRRYSEQLRQALGA